MPNSPLIASIKETV